MTRSGIAVVVLAIALPLSAGASASTTAPAVRAKSFAPLSVSGTHFRPAERVRVTLESPMRHAVAARVQANGTFVAVFVGVTVQRCDGLLLRVTGSKGSSAVLRLPKLMCASTIG
jgi:hypothetical protein